MIKSATLARLALYLSLGLVIWFAIAAFGPKFGLIGWKTGFITMTVGWGPYLIGAAAAVSAIALVAVEAKPPRAGWGTALMALFIPAMFFGALAMVKVAAEGVPPIHDVTTDTARAPEFSAAILELRRSVDANPITDFSTMLGHHEMWQDERFAAVADKTPANLIAASFPDLAPVSLALPPKEAIAAVVKAMKAKGINDIRIDAANGRVEGVAETFLYGFKDDVVARIVPAQNGTSVVDFRSTSRAGISDLGVNAQRIAGLIGALKAP